jgi:hypothetical protein
VDYRVNLWNLRKTCKHKLHNININININSLREELTKQLILKDRRKITENFMEMLLDMVNQNLQETLKKFQDTKNKENKKTQKQMS